MVSRLKSLWPNLSQSLGFIPGFIVLIFAILGVALVEIDAHVDLEGTRYVFNGDGPAARTVLSVIAGSLITVAGLTFSITMVVLQLASSQFSPRILRTFFGDRVVQLTIGTYVGTFVYAMLVLRGVGSYGAADFVPRLSVTVATLLGIAAVVLLIVFLHHVSQMVQVSHVVSNIANLTLARADVMYPDPYGDSAASADEPEPGASWRSEKPGVVVAPNSGYVQRIGLDDLAKSVGQRASRLSILTCPGDFVRAGAPVAEVWPADAAEECRTDLLQCIAIDSERDLQQDVDFGVRQLADIAIKALSPGINDPATAVTCIGHLSAILVRLTEHATPDAERKYPDHDLTIVARQRQFDEYVEEILQINRYVAGDAWVIGELLALLQACGEAAERCGADERRATIRAAVEAIAEQAASEVKNERDRGVVSRLAAEALDGGDPVRG